MSNIIYTKFVKNYAKLNCYTLHRVQSGGVKMKGSGFGIPSPLIDGLTRSVERLLVGEGFYAGELLAFEEFEARAAAGGDVGDLVGYAGLVDGADGVAATDD